jgi:WxcM-like, C-terminal
MHKVIDLSAHYSLEKKNASINGLMIPVWNILEHFNDLKSCNYIYLTTILPDKVKGPYLHSKRNSFLLSVSGECVIVIQENNEYHIIHLSPYRGVILSDNTPMCIYGSGRTESVLLNICDYPWTINSTECIVPESFNFDFSTLKDI